MSANGVAETSATESAAVSSRDPEYRWNLLSAIVLSLATLASAWCGFQASLWNHVYSHESRTATGERFESERQAAIADRQLSNDLSIFSLWLEAKVSENEVLASEVEQRFQPHFQEAFDTWIAFPVEAGMHVPAGTPFEQADYVLPTQKEADAATARAEEALEAADFASEASNSYVLNSLLFASVLFLAGIASKLSLPRMSHGVVVVAGVVMAASIALLLTQPVRF